MNLYLLCIFQERAWQWRRAAHSAAEPTPTPQRFGQVCVYTRAFVWRVCVCVSLLTHCRAGRHLHSLRGFRRWPHRLLAIIPRHHLPIPLPPHLPPRPQPVRTPSLDPARCGCTPAAAPPTSTSSTATTSSRSWATQTQVSPSVAIARAVSRVFVANSKPAPTATPRLNTHTDPTPISARSDDSSDSFCGGDEIMPAPAWNSTDN
jgi:hypothetical protein